MNNNNWLKSIAKTYIQLNENTPGHDMTDLGKRGRSLTQQQADDMESRGIRVTTVIFPEHGNPFNEDGSLNPSHPNVARFIERSKRKFPSDTPTETVLRHIKVVPRELDGKQKGFFMHLMDAPVSLNEARKLKPTATDRKKNIEIERSARAAHQHAANAITSVPGFKIHPKYPGYDNPEDPEHGSVMAHLADVAPAVTDPKTAIELVATKHGVDPQAAIAALGSSAPMSPQDFMKAMRR